MRVQYRAGFTFILYYARTIIIMLCSNFYIRPYTYLVGKRQTGSDVVRRILMDIRKSICRNRVN